MLKEAELIKEEIVQSRDELGKKIAEFQAELHESVELTAGELHDALDHLKVTARNLSPSYQVRQHPLPAVGLAGLAGFLLTRPVGPRSAQRRAGLWEKFLDTFSEEISLVKGIALGAVVKALAEKASVASPTLAPHIAEVERSLLGRVGKRDFGTKGA